MSLCDRGRRTVRPWYSFKYSNNSRNRKLLQCFEKNILPGRYDSCLMCQCYGWPTPFAFLTLPMIYLKWTGSTLPVKLSDDKSATSTWLYLTTFALSSLVSFTASLLYQNSTHNVKQDLRFRLMYISHTA